MKSMRTRKHKPVSFGVAICMATISFAEANAAELPLPARSWGGVVRSGPGGDYPRVASLREGDAVTILARTGVTWNGFEWLKISYHGNQVGYQWGGILCPIGTALQGTYEVCQARDPMPVPK
jgi:uncharacterized protein YraI